MSEPTEPAFEPLRDHNNLNALTFQATSAEQHALCVQAYRLARHALRERLQSGLYERPCVVLDLDETVLDNSAYQAWLIADGRNFDPESWDAWCQDGRAGAIPGSCEFVRYVRANGCEAFFVTSRNNATRVATATNLHALRLLSDEELAAERASPGGDPARTRLFMAKMPDADVAGTPRRLPNKFEQRTFIEDVRGYEIMLSVGDNLADYAEYYGSLTDAAGKAFTPMPRTRLSSAKQDDMQWGVDFVLIPNASYGGWLRAFQANCIGSPSELAATDEPVRGGLDEAQGAVPQRTAAGGCKATAGPRFSEANLNVWKPRSSGGSAAG